MKWSDSGIKKSFWHQRVECTRLAKTCSLPDQFVSSLLIVRLFGSTDGLEEGRTKTFGSWGQRLRSSEGIWRKNGVNRFDESGF